MMFRRILASSVALFGIQGQAFAADNLTIQLPLLGYSSANMENKPDGGTTTKAKKSAVSTADYSSGYFQFSLENVQVYLYPFSATKKVSVGYSVGPIEAGVNLGINTSSVDKPKNDTTNNIYGVYGLYMATLGKDISLETILSIDSSTTTSKVDTVNAATGVATTAETDASGMDMGLSVNVVKGITKHISYVGGLSYTMSTLDTKKPAKVKDTTSGFGVNLATFRYAFN